MYHVCVIFRCAFWFIVVPLTGACTSVVSINVDDNVEFGNLEASFPLAEDNPGRIRVRAADVSGDFNQFVASSQQIQINDTLISGPVDVGGEMDLTYFSIAIGKDQLDDESLPRALRTSFYFGLSQTNFDLTLQDAGATFHKSDDTLELYLQAGLYTAVSNSLDIGFTWALSIGRDVSGISEYDLILDYEISKQLRITGGYRWFEYAYRSKEDESDIEVDFRGPFIGLHMPF